jgi:hypothetical protein
MKKLLFIVFLILGSLAIVVQTSAISDSNKASASSSAKAPKKSPAPRDLVYYRNIFLPRNNVGC